MKLNGTAVVVQQVNMAKVDGSLVIHDPTSEKIIMFNETSSFIWKIILEHEKNDDDVVTSHIVHEISEAYGISEDRRQEICHDVEEILQNFFNSGLLKTNS
jgi:hypothetical protein